MRNNYQFKPLRKKLGNSIYREIIERTMLRAYALEEVPLGDRIGKVVLTINPKYTNMDCNNCSKRNLFLQFRFYVLCVVFHLRHQLCSLINSFRYVV